MEKKILKLFERAVRAQEKYKQIEEELEKELKEICDFNVGVTFCQGDGVLLIDDDSSDVFVKDCLKGKSKRNKLTLDECQGLSLWTV